MNNTFAFQDQMYQRYQLRWMMEHGYTLTDFLSAIFRFEFENTELGVVTPKDIGYDTRAVRAKIEEWETDQGFSGAIYASFQEFINSEYLDREYMKGLLNPSEYVQYEQAVNQPVLIPVTPITTCDLEHKGVKCIGAYWLSDENNKFLFLVNGRLFVYQEKGLISTVADTDHIRLVIEEFLASKLFLTGENDGL